MLLRLRLLALSLVVSACAPAQGLWYLNLGPLRQADQTLLCQENYFRARCVQGAEDSVPDLIVTENDTFSDGGIFAEMVKGGTGEWLLLLGPDIVLVGNKVGEGWEFEWLGASDEQETHEHATGYIASDLVSHDRKVTLSLTYSNVTASYAGVLRMDFEDVHDRQEPDIANAEVSRYFGWIDEMALEYLEATDDDEGSDPRINQIDDPECESDTCRIRITASGRNARDVTGTWIEGEHANDGTYFDYLSPEGADWTVGLLEPPA